MPVNIHRGMQHPRDRNASSVRVDMDNQAM
jgi:hypothetical protein